MVNLAELEKEQEKLSKNVSLNDGFKKIEKIAGIDQTYIGTDVISCIVVCNAKTMDVIEKQCAQVPSLMPYKPGFLAYRDMPAMVEAYSKLTTTPDVIIIDGHGIAHPRYLGLASHFGLVIGRPTIGVAKNLVTGRIEGGKIYIEKDLCGFELITREHANPIYVSPGHMVSPGTALRIVRESIKHPHKLPEPLHLAHKSARKAMKEAMEKKQD
jgi:deoxyribonuclease V